MLKRILEFCAAHEVPEEDAATVVERGRDTGLPLAGAGAPCVSEFAIIELAAALGMTVDAGKRLVGQVLEVRHRLPRIWRRVVKGELAWWRAGRIAQHTMHLPKAGAALVDGRLAATAHKVGVAHTEKLCQEALDHYDPIQAEERRIAAAENRQGRRLPGRRRPRRHRRHRRDHRHRRRHRLRDRPRPSRPPTRRRRVHRLPGRPPLASDRRDRPPLPRHRARPIGQTATGDDQRPPPRPGHRPLRHHPRPHLRGAGQGLVHPPRHPSRSSSRSRTSTSTSGSTQYEVPDRLDEQVTERDGTCIHPWCTRPATSCDDDHCIPYDQGGETSSDQHRPTLPTTSPHQDPRTMALPIPQTRRLPLAITHRPLVPPRRPGTTDLGRLTP